MSNKSQSIGCGDPPGGADQTKDKLTDSQIRDFVNSVETLNVVVQRPVAGWKPIHPIDEDSFTLSSEGSKGLALLINIVEFDDDIANASRRYGSEHDLELLTDLLIQLDYNLYPTAQKIRERKHKPKGVIKSQIDSFKTLCTQQHPESIFVFIGSHGKHPNKIVTSDRQWMDIYEDIIYKFTHDPNFTVLEGKPKIFLVQACQSYCSNDQSTMTHANVHQGQQDIRDVYICTSTTPGKASKRDFYKGSWFPYCFTYMMMNHALHMKSLQQIMELVRKMMLQIEDHQEFKQVPSFISGSNDKPLYFVTSDYNWDGVRNYEKNLSWLEGDSKFCIICTIDTQITREKVTENFGHSSVHLHEWKDFPEFLSSDGYHFEEGVVDVVMGYTLKHFELILNKLDQINRQRIIFIAYVDRHSVLKLDPAKYKVDVRVDPMTFEDLCLPYQFKIMERLQSKYGISLGEDELNGELLVDIISGRELFHDEIKSNQLSYYVPRMLLTRNIISDELFEKRYFNDIFIVRGIQRSHLSFLVKTQMTGRTQDNLEKITVNFMTLGKDIHFDKICKNSSKSVHLLNYDNGKFRWVQTWGNIKSIQVHVAKEQEEQHEENFCSLICANSCAPVCIADSPGMGKTILLAQNGKRVRRMFPDRTVLFVELSTFIQRVKHEKGPTDGIDKKTIVKVLQDTVCKTLLERHVLESKLNSDVVSIELLLDGFDEVKLEDSNFAHEILKTIRQSFSSVRMWVTSRPHKLEELEVTLGGLGYNIKPFQETDQINFLERFWLQHTKKRNTERLRNFARHCLQSLKRKMSSSEQDIAGIPIQCFLIGEVYEERALEHAELDTTSLFPQEHLISSIATLYQKVIEKKMAIYRSKFRPHGSRTDFELNRDVILNWLLGLGGTLFGKGSSQKERQQLSDVKLNDLHALLGISIIFPDLFRELKHSFDPLEMNEILNVGIWELADGTEPRVLHRTFAEYFTALFIRDRLISGDGWGKVLSKFFVENALQSKVAKYKSVEFIYPVVIHFLNSLLTPDPHIAIPCNVAKDMKEAVNDSQLSQLVYACAYADCDNILKYFDTIGVFSDSATASSIFNKGFISCVIEHSGVEVTRLGFLHYEQHHQDEFHSDMKCELLRLAVERGHDPGVEFLINEKGLRTMVENLHDGTRMLIHQCIMKTTYNTQADIGQRIEILRMLDGINKALKEERDADGNTALLAKLSHVRLCIELICLGADVTAQPQSKGTILHLRTNYLDGDSYHSVVKLIHESGKLEELVHLKSCINRTPLLDIMIALDPKPETLELFKIAGADFNHTSYNGWSALMFAIFCCRSISTLQNLIDLGADVYATRYGDTLLHVAADKAIPSVAALEFLVTVHGLDVNAMNDRGQTPLDIVFEKTCNFEMGLAIFELDGRNKNCNESLSRWTTRDIFEGQGKRTMVGVAGFDDEIDMDLKSHYVDILLLHIYLFGPEVVESGKYEMSPPSPHPLNYEYLKALLIGKGAKDRHYGAMGRLNEILHNTIERTNPPIWDPDTINKFQSGELVCPFKRFPYHSLQR